MKKFKIDSFLNGTELRAYKYFGAHSSKRNGKLGYIFRVYAPLAKEVYLIGSFTNWRQNPIPLVKTSYCGIYEVFVPNLKKYAEYKYLVLTSDNKYVERMDAYEFMHELRPGTASKLISTPRFNWNDREFMMKRTTNLDKPMSIFEVHLGSFRKPKDREFYSYEEMVDILIPYLVEYGFTHVEFMPLTYHPFDGSWGYQSLGFFSVDSRYGNVQQLKYLIDSLHRAGIGVILDYVPLHFATDEFGLLNYDGSSIYEYNDDRKFSPWGSVQFDLGKDPVRSFLMSSMNYFLEEFHFDGIRIDAVSNIIFFGGDSSRGVNEGAHEFIKRANSLLKKAHPSVMIIAEDSSDFSGVTKSLKDGGLGFDYKWDLGWMNDTLKYYESDTAFRGDIHGRLTFSMAYFYNESFILPLSHDEVVHGKKSMMNKMFGDETARFAQVRNLFTYQFMHPGKKLNFMGNELAVWDEWNPERQFPDIFETLPMHLGVRVLFKDLNALYKGETALFAKDYDQRHFVWLRLYAANECVFVFERFVEDSHLICVLNTSSNNYEDYEVELRDEGRIKELINTDNSKYAGSTPEREIGWFCKTYKVNRDKNLQHAFRINLRPYMAAVYKLTKTRKK